MKAVNVKRIILSISAIAADIMSIWPYDMVASPLFFKTGSIIPTEVVTMIRAKYHVFLI